MVLSTISIGNYYFNGAYAKENVKDAVRYLENEIEKDECIFAPTVKEVVEHYLEKPFRIADVVRAVEQCFDQEQGEASTPDPEISQEAEAALNAGVAAYKAGRVDEAVEHLRQGVKIDPLAYRLHFHLGLLYGKRNQVYEAISELETAIEINSRHFAAVKNLAILYQKAGFRNRAVEMWQRALSLAPDDATKQTIKQHLLQLL